jgi:hypothetical protein
MVKTLDREEIVGQKHPGFEVPGAKDEVAGG